MPNCKLITVQTESQCPEKQKESLRRACGCLRTSDKLRNILKMFPQPPPPSPACKDLVTVNLMRPDTCNVRNSCDAMSAARKQIAQNAYGAQMPTIYIQDLTQLQQELKSKKDYAVSQEEKEKRKSKLWYVISELVSLIQLSVTATALALYYLIYCYMQLIYYTLRSAVYFHQVDAPMKITIAIVTVTALVIGVHFLYRMEEMIGIHFRPL